MSPTAYPRPQTLPTESPIPASPRRQPKIDSPLALQHIPLTFENGDQDESALTLVYAVVPEWRSDPGTVEFHRFTEGITNTLMKAMKRRPGASASQIDRESILIRAFGEGTNTLIDRERELRAHNLLATLGLAPALLARFNNGLMYRYIEGDVCSPEDLRRPEIYRLVAQRLGQWHAVLPVSALTSNAAVAGTNDIKSKQANDDSAEPTPSMWTVIQQWIDVLPTTSPAEKTMKQALQTEYALLKKLFGKLQGLDGRNYVFSHCDLLSGNVIISKHESKGTANGSTHRNSLSTNPAPESVSFIDYEYATPAPAAFDIANHFAEWAGLDCEYGAVPTKSQRREFLENYITSFRTHSPRSTPNDCESLTRAEHGNSTNPANHSRDVEQLNEQINLLRGLPGFYWGIWALIQATISQIDFDYKSYAELRLGEYWGWKAEWDGSRQAQGKVMGERERRWAEE